jgi:23S rRNA-/tRNA-specific pseudouridylate synthase
VTKLRLRPLTGRRHQLRVHCLCMGHTIVGDYTYGVYSPLKLLPTQNADGRSGMGTMENSLDSSSTAAPIGQLDRHAERMMLHAHRLL